jgi:hypothetical protein
MYIIIQTIKLNNIKKKMQNYLTFRCKKCFLIPKIYNIIVNDYKENQIITECQNKHLEKIPLDEFVNNNRISLDNSQCKECKNNISLYYCLNCYKTICNECFEKSKNKSNKIKIKELDTLCLLHKQKYTHKCDKCNLLICEKCSDAHIKHGKSEIYYNFYIKKHKKEIKSKIKSFNVNNSHISDENRKIFYKNQLPFNKFKLLLINDYEIFEKNKTYNNYLIENYKYIFVNFEPINLEYEKLLNHNLIYKINDDKHFFTSNPSIPNAPIKQGSYSDKGEH